MKFLEALYYDTIGQDDRAHSIMGITNLKGKNAYRTKVAILCAVAGIAGAFFTMGISLLLLLVSARKLFLVATDKA